MDDDRSDRLAGYYVVPSSLRAAIEPLLERVGVRRHPRTVAQSSTYALAMPLRHYYRVTKYDPALRDATGSYTGDSWTRFDQIGQTFGGRQLTLRTYLDVEACHLVAVAAFLEESNTTSVVAEGVENSRNAFRVSEGDQLSPVETADAVRQMLREEGWCRLVDGDRFYIHVGWDYYVYVGTDRPCDSSVALAESRGLFVDQDFASPYLVDD